MNNRKNQNHGKETTSRQGASRLPSFRFEPGKYRLIEEGVPPLPDTPEMRKAIKDIGNIIDQKKEKTLRWLKRQVKKGKGGKTPEIPTEMPKECFAIILLFMHRDWSDPKIAEAVGVNQRSVYQWKSYNDFRAELERDAKAGARLLHGYIKRFQDGTTDVDAMAPKSSPDD